MAGQGFASMSKERRRQLASKGGKNAAARGRKHSYNKFSAKQASNKGVSTRRTEAARSAAMRLMRRGFTPEVLDLVKLTMDEFIYYGGSKMNQSRLDELCDRIKALGHEPFPVEEDPQDSCTDESGS